VPQGHLSDATGHLFIESKTKRLTVGAKTLGDPAALDKDLSVMATAIVQHYRNIRDALDSKTRWVPDKRPLYPMILTLEDWFMFSPRVRDRQLVADVQRSIDGLKIMLGVPDLRRVDPDSLSIGTEELVLRFQNSAPLLDLKKPTLEPDAR
jgi:hypothetical protein